MAEKEQEMEQSEELWTEEDRRALEELGGATVETAWGRVCVLTIIGQIEGHQALASGTKGTRYEHILPLLAKVEGSRSVDGVLVLLNTVGGDIEAGLGMAEMLAGMDTPTVSLVLGGSHSIGVPLAVAARRSFIAPTAAMTIHPVRLTGTVIGVSQMFDYFRRTQDRVVDFILAHSRIQRETLLQLLLERGELTGDVGSILYGQQAVDVGLIHQVGGISDAFRALEMLCKAESGT